jgi:PAS domain S-box-containing protein
MLAENAQEPDRNDSDPFGQMNAEDRLFAQVEFFQILFDTLPIPVFHVDLKNTLLMCNQAFEQVMQKVREEFIGRTVEDVLPRSELAELIACPPVDLDSVQEPPVRTGTVTYMDGSNRDIEVRHVIVFDLSGEPSGAVGMIIDLTDRKRAEAAEIEAERLRAVRQIAISVAHEFNNPLMIISGVVQLMNASLGDSLDAEMKNHLERIPRAVNRMKVLVEKLMNLKQLREAEYVNGTSFIDLDASADEEDESSDGGGSDTDG